MTWESKQVVAAFTGNKDHQKDVQEILARLIHDPEVIRNRQEMIDDLLCNPELVDRLATLLPIIDSLASFSYRSKQEMNSLYEVAWRMGELQNIVDCIAGLGEILQGVEHPLKSQGFRLLLDEVLKVRQTPTFQNLVKELPDLLAKITCASVPLGST
jgi:hypothetical protein